MINKKAMKKILILLISILIFPFFTHAEDCMRDPIYDRDWNAVVTTGVRVRSIPCMESSTVLTTVPVGEILKVTAETDGYYKVKLLDGTEGWIGQWLVEKTDKPFDKDASEGSKELFFDVNDHIYETAVRYLKDKNIIGGYPDGSFQPNKTVNRAEFTKIIVGAALKYNPDEDMSAYDVYSISNLNFSDIESGAWYVPYLRKAVQNKIIDGYPDGTFKPAKNINLAEASKILVNALGLSKKMVKTNIWYRPYIESMQGEKYIPADFIRLDQLVTRGQMSEMIWRISEKISDKTAANFKLPEEEFEETEIYTLDSGSKIIDMSQVRETWLKWYNDERNKEGKPPFEYNKYLDWAKSGSTF